MIVFKRILRLTGSCQSVSSPKSKLAELWRIPIWGKILDAADNQHELFFLSGHFKETPSQSVSYHLAILYRSYHTFSPPHISHILAPTKCNKNVTNFVASQCERFCRHQSRKISFLKVLHFFRCLHFWKLGSFLEKCHQLKRFGFISFPYHGASAAPCV